MRIGVLDIGSNTGHLLIVDAIRGGPPIPAHSFKKSLRLAEHLDANDHVNPRGIAALTTFIADALVEAEKLGCSTILTLATSAIRDSANADQVLATVNEATGIDLRILPGEDEARLTFLAVRRWFGWSSGRLGVFDIGGGSLEMAIGRDETPDAAVSLPLGAGRLTREWLDHGASVAELRSHVRQAIASDAGRILREGPFDHAVATSKTFRSLARVLGAAPREEGPYIRRVIKRPDAAGLVDKLSALTVAQIAQLPGVSLDRAHQMVAGAVVAEAVIDLFDVSELEICPWALREGVLIEHQDHL